MAKIVVPRDQQEEMRRRYPKPAYSRVIVQDLNLLAAGGGYDYLISGPVGDRVWLLSVDVWFQPISIGGFISLWFQIKTGQTDKASLSDVVFAWESVIDVPDHVDNHIYKYGDLEHRRFDMMKFYKGKGRRFAAVGQTFGASVECYISVAYQISEG